MKKETSKIHVATDHAGFDLKEAMKDHLYQAGWTVIDHGAGSLNKDDDYPDFIHPAAKAVSDDEQSAGIIFGHSGQGEAMVANRYPYVRATVYYGGSSEIIKLSREHNDANILSLAAGLISEEQALSAIGQWLETDFSKATRHQRRIEKIDDNFMS